MQGLEILAAALRGAHVAALVSLFGAPIFLLLVAPTALDATPAQARRLRHAVLRIAGWSAALGLATAAAWLLATTVLIADPGGVAALLHALPTVAADTQFGHWLMLRCVVLLLVLAALRPKRNSVVVAAVLSGAAIAVQPMLGHAGAMGGGAGTTMIVSEVVHLLAAGAWLGGLLPLFLAVTLLPPGAAAASCRGFTRLGLAAALLLAGSATAQIALLGGTLPGLFHTGYGRTALLKLGLFLALLALAALNRFRLTGRLDGAAPHPARRQMRMSIGVEAVLGLAVVIAAAFLASQPPNARDQTEGQAALTEFAAELPAAGSKADEADHFAKIPIGIDRVAGSQGSCG